MILTAAATAFYETSEFWTAVQAIAALASVFAAFIALKASNRAHKESGPMISISMRPYLYASTNHGAESRTEITGSYSVQRIGSPQIELALITVVNTGRSAATINGVYLMPEGADENPGLRETVREMPGTGRLETASFRGGPVVIEPYSEISVLVDFWGYVNRKFSKHADANQLILTAVVDVVGTGKPIVSQKHGQWVVMRGHRSFSGDHRKVRPIDVLATELAWQFKDLTVCDILLDQMQNVEQQMQPDYPFLKVATALDPWEANKRGPLAADNVSYELTKAAKYFQSKVKMIRAAGELIDPPEKVTEAKLKDK